MIRLASHPVLRAGVGLLGLGLLVHAAHGLTGFGRPGVDDAIKTWLYAALMFGGTGVCLARCALVREERLAWLALGTNLGLWAIGDLIFDLGYSDLAEPPFPNLADPFYFASYAAAYVGLVALLRARLRPFRASLWLDGVVGGLTLAAVAAALVFPAVVASTEGAPISVAVTLGYPLCDLLLLAFLGVAFGMCGWRPGTAWLLVGLSLALTAVGDTIYTYGEAVGSYVEGGIVDSFWPASVLALALAAWTPRPVETQRRDGLVMVALPGLFALVAVGLLLYGQVAEISLLAAGLAAAALLAAVVRAGLTFAENLELLRATRREALSDALTGLGNRRRLLDELDGLLAEADVAPRTLVFFDLDGFKAYNDCFGHAAGDALLHRLGRQLAVSVAGGGAAYRLGGDEFCVLLARQVEADDPVIALAAKALSEHGPRFSIGASYGLVALPADASTSGSALQLADERMYRHKDSKRSSSRRQANDVLLQVLDEREPELREHLDGVADLALRVGRHLGLDAEQLDVLSRGAELHDVGKVAVPDEILHKPGPLDAAEWRLMHQHTVIGERILLAAPALRPVAELVRSSHERWDGRGYPDGLAGEAIPVGARVIAVCDAFDAMISQRAYGVALTHAEALEELRRCAGSQFDPAVVDAFVAAAGAVKRRPAPVAG